MEETSLYSSVTLSRCHVVTLSHGRDRCDKCDKSDKCDKCDRCDKFARYNLKKICPVIVAFLDSFLYLCRMKLHVCAQEPDGVGLMRC